MNPVLNSALDRDGVAKDFARDRRVHIPSILAEKSATRVANLTPQKEAELMNAAYAGARVGFHYLYDGHVLSRDGEPYPDPSHYLSAITAFLNSAPLLFSDRPGHVSEGYLPAFNALNIFAVPQDHMVTFISPFAGAHRLSITGWFRSRAP